MKNNVLCIQIVFFHLLEHFSYLNTLWSQLVRISDFRHCPMERQMQQK